MRVEVTIDKTKPLPAGALEALSGEFSKRINQQFSDTDNKIQVRYAGSNNLSVMGAPKTDRDRIEEILQETWESADEWFSSDN